MSVEKRIAAEIESLVFGFVASGNAKDAYGINCGYCDLFAEQLIRNMEDAGYTGMEEVWVDNFLVDPDGADTGEGLPFARDRLARLWPEAGPPEGMSWDELDEVSAMVGLGDGSHVWMSMDGRHYDSETPGGVENPFELPYFVRGIEAWRKRTAAPLP